MNDHDFFAAFADKTLPWCDWTHLAHVRMGFLCLRRMTLSEASAWVREHLRAYNLQNGSNGYHETITQAFLVLIASRMAAFPRASAWEGWIAHCPDLCNGLSPLYAFYSSECIKSEAARLSWVPPDIASLPIAPPNGL